MKNINQSFLDAVETHQLEVAIVWFCEKMTEFYILKTKEKYEEAKSLVIDMRYHLKNLIEYGKKIDSEMIYVLWEQF